MPRHARNRPRPTRSPVTYNFEGYLIEAYNHVDDLPLLSDAPRKRPRHATRGAAAAERAADLASVDATPSPPSLRPVTRRNSSRNLRTGLVQDVERPKPAMRAMKPRVAKGRFCNVCLRKGTVCTLLKCVECALAVHSYCLNPPQPELPNGGVWTCKTCGVAPVARKKQAVRAFREAVKKYSFLMTPAYLASVTESVSMAASTAITSRPRRDAVAELGFAEVVLSEAPTSRPTENTIILRAPETESDELVDVQVVKAEPEIEAEHVQTIRSTRRLTKRMVAARTAAGSTTEKHTVPSNRRKRAWDSTPVFSPGQDNSSKASLGESKKKARVLQTDSPPVSARGSMSPGDGRPSSAVRGDGVPTATNRATVPIDNSNPTKSPDVAKCVQQVEVHQDPPHRTELDSHKEKGPIVLRLRRKPPTRASIEKTRLASTGETGLLGAAKESCAQAQMHKRLAKARAMKAERRLLKARRAAEVKTTDQTGGSRTKSQDQRSTASYPAKVMAKMKLAAAKEDAAEVEMHEQPRNLDDGESIALKESNASSIVAMPSKEGGNDELTGSLSRPSGHDSKKTGNAAEEKLRRNNPVTREILTDAPKAMSSPDVPVLDSAPADCKLEVSLEKEDAFSPMHPTQLDVSKESRSLTVEGKLPEPASKGSKSDSCFDVSQEKVLPRKETSCVDLTDEGADPLSVAPKCTPEQRAVAKMANLFQSSGRATEAGLRPVGSKWGDMGLDAKNEALFTLALGQKGAGGRRPPGTSTAGNVTDREIALRNSKSQGRTDNVPASERKRMQVTALAASVRGRGTSITTVSETAGNKSRKSSICRLLSNPAQPNVGSPDGDVAERVASKGAAPGSNRQISSQMLDSEDRLVCHAAPLSIDATPPTSERGNLTLLTHIPTVRNVPTAKRVGNSRASAAPAPQSTLSSVLSHDSQRDRPISPNYGPSRGAQRSAGIPLTSFANHSSHSESQSEPGSSTPGGHSLQTLKRRRRRSTMATLSGNAGSRTNTHSRAQSGIHQQDQRDIFNVRELGQQREEIIATGGGRGDVVGRDGYSRHAPPAFTRNSQSGLHRPRASGTAIQFGSQGPVEGQVEVMEPPTDSGSVKNRSLSGTWTARGYTITKQEDAPPPPVSVAGYGTSAGSSYRDDSVSRLSREIPQVPQARSYQEPQMVQSHNPVLSFGSHVPSSNTVHAHARQHREPARSDIAVAPLSEEFLQDPLSESSRRLRRSAAPTLPTAARRAQYEKGRALAMMSPTAAATEHQHAYSAARRYRASNRDVEDSFIAPHGRWDASRDTGAYHSDSVRVPGSAYAQSLNAHTPAFNHQVGGRESMTPLMAPVAYEPEVANRNIASNNGSYWGEDFPQLLEVTNRPPTQPRIRHFGSSYRLDGTGGPVHPSQAPLPERVFHHPQSMLVRVPRVTDMRRHDSAMFRAQGTDADIGIVNRRDRVVLGSGRDDDAFRPGPHLPDHPELEPARTDPSLKNLLS